MKELEFKNHAPGFQEHLKHTYWELLTAEGRRSARRDAAIAAIIA
jgi:hypothetical protein